MAGLALVAVVGCGSKDGPETIVKQSDLPAPKQNEDQQQGQTNESGVGTGIRRIGEVQKN